MFYINAAPNSMNSPCANQLCGFRFRQGQPPAKARYYHVNEKRWVCTSCAQSMNREHLGKSNKYGAVYKPLCISSEDAMMHILSATSP